MKFAVVGGDRRSALLAGLLLREGNRVRSFALEKAELPAEIPKDSCLQSCVYGADAVLLPVPAESGPVLNAPLAAAPLPLAELWSALWPGQLVIGGGFSGQSAAASETDEAFDARFGAQRPQLEQRAAEDAEYERNNGDVVYDPMPVI